LIEKWKHNLDKFIKKIVDNKKSRYIVIIALMGILLIIVSNIFSTKENVTSQIEHETYSQKKDEDIEEVSLIANVNEIEENYENQLQVMLNEVIGLSEVEVMINIDSTNVNIYEKDLIVGMQTTDETDRNGGVRNVEDETKETKLVVLRQGDQEVPLLVQTKKPEIRGVLIIAKGADNATAKKTIIDAISKVLDVPTYRISVMPK